MPARGIGIKVDTPTGLVKLYFTTANSASHLQKELQCHRIDVNAGRVIKKKGAEYVMTPAPELAVTEHDDTTYATLSPEAKRAVAASVDVVADRLYDLVGTMPSAVGGVPRPIIVNCHAGRHRSPACVVAFIRKYGRKPDGARYTDAEAKAMVTDTFARKAAKMEAKRGAHAPQPQGYFHRTVADLQLLGQ